MEEVEIIKVAFEGTEMFYRLAGASIKDALKLLKLIFTAGPQALRWHNESKERSIRKKITKKEYDTIKNKSKVYKGSIDFKKFMKRYSAEERTIINIPDSSSKVFDNYAEKYNLVYTVLPDLNMQDNQFQIMVPISQQDIYKSIIEKLSAEEMAANLKRQNELQKEIDNLKKQRAKMKKELNKMSKEGKEDTEEYKTTEENLKKCERDILNKETEISKLKDLYTKEMTYEEYANTNKFALNHTGTFIDLMDSGIEPVKSSLTEFITYKKDTSVLNNSITKSFDKALSDVTERKDIRNTDKKVIICDSTNLENYIEAFTYTKEQDGKTFICSQYDLYVDGEKQRCDEFSHGEFTHYSDAKANNSSEVGDEHWNNMKLELKDKGHFNDNVLTFESEEDYKKYLNDIQTRDGSEYLVNSDLKGLSVKREDMPDNSVKFTLIKNGEETNISCSIKESEDKAILPFIRIVNSEAKKVNPDADMEDGWIKVDSTENYKICSEVISGKIPSNKEDLKKDFEALTDETFQEKVRDEGRTLAEENKNIIDVPENTLLQLYSREKYKEYIMYSDDMNYFIRILGDCVKADRNGNGKALILDKDEAVEIIDKKTNKVAGLITDKNSLELFMAGDRAGLDNTLKNVKQYQIRGGKVAAKV